MALPVLRPIPKDDPRPTARSVEVIGRSYDVSAEEIIVWNRDRSLIRKAEELKACCVSAIQSADGDAYGAARCLEEGFGFHSDYELVRLLHEVIQRSPSKLPGVISEWVMRHQLRFPGKPADLIVFRDRWRHLRIGRVNHLKNSDATALVDFENSDRSEYIPAECVVENRTSGETPDIHRKPPQEGLTLTANVVEFRKNEI